MKPYRNLQSKNLALMLLLARVFVYLGSILLAFSIVMLASMFLSGTGMLGATTGAAIFPMSLILFIASSLLASIVAFEENYRLRTEHLVRKNEI